MIRFLTLRDLDRIFPDPDRGGAPFPREGENKQITPFWFKRIKEGVFDSNEERDMNKNPIGHRTPEEFDAETQRDAVFVPKEFFPEGLGAAASGSAVVGNAPDVRGSSKLRPEIKPLGGKE